MYTRANQVELTEIVRLYAKGLINYHDISPFPYPTSEDDKIDGKVAFGKTTKQDVKRKRKKKKGPRVFGNQELRDSLHKDRISKPQLALLAERAKQAMQQASQLAGERVIYCCGYIKIESTIEEECEYCRDSRRHQIINSLLEE